MRNALLLGGLATVIAIAALAVSIIALLAPAGESSDDDADVSLQLADRGEFTVEMVLNAIERHESEGREATVNYYNSPESVDGEWYVFIFDEADKLIAHADPNQLGRDLKGDLGVDSAGYRFGDVMLTADNRGLWVDYVFLNLQTGNQEYKHAWVLRHDGLLFGSGWYQILPEL